LHVDRRATDGNAAAEKRLTPILSQSHFANVNDSSAKTSNGSSIKHSPLENDQNRNFPVKTKPTAPPAVRQSSFSSRVAIALAQVGEEVGSGVMSGENTSRADLDSGDATTSPAAPLSSAAVGAQADSRVTSSGVDGEPGQLYSGAATPPYNPEEARGLSDMLYNPDDAVNSGKDAEEGTGSPQESGNRKQRRHRTSFLKAKSQNSEKAHEYHDKLQTIMSEVSGKEDGEGVAVDGAEAEAGGSGVAARERAYRKLQRQQRQLLKQISDLNEVARSIMQTYIYSNAEHQVNLPATMRLRCERHFSRWCAALANAPRMDLMAPSVDTGDPSLGSMSVSMTPKGAAGAREIKLGNIPKGANFGSSLPSVQFRNAYGGEQQMHELAAPSQDSYQTLGATSLNDPMITPDSLQSQSLSPHPAGNNNKTTTAPGAQSSTEHTAASISFGASLVVDHRDNYSLGSDPAIDMEFIELFREVKQEILKLLRDDKFPRWKATAEFVNFIASIKPYNNEKEVEKQQSFDRSLMSGYSAYSKEK
jgi:hypothetical protein